MNIGFALYRYDTETNLLVYLTAGVKRINTKDIKEKLLSCLLFVNEFNEPEELGTDFYNEKLEKVKEECFKHLERMNTAKRKISHLFPLTIEKYDCLSDDEIAYIDQFLFRFSKLQDTMGTKLFPLTLLIVGEEKKINRLLID